MQLGRVVGRLWSTVKAPALEAQRLLLIQPVNAALAACGKTIVCTDCCGAGAGELVYWVRGREASFPFLPAQTPTDATVIAIVDELNLAPAVPVTTPQPAEGNGKKKS